MIHFFTEKTKKFEPNKLELNKFEFVYLKANNIAVYIYSSVVFLIKILI